MTVACPACGGAGGREIGAFGHRGWSPDRVCGGTGRLELVRAIRVREGREERATRQSRGETLREAAGRLGIAPWLLDARESGREA